MNIEKLWLPLFCVGVVIIFIIFGYLLAEKWIKAAITIAIFIIMAGIFCLAEVKTEESQKEVTGTYEVLRLTSDEDGELVAVYKKNSECEYCNNVSLVTSNSGESRVEEYRQEWGIFLKEDSTAYVVESDIK